jgi:hypothetical protein
MRALVLAATVAAALAAAAPALACPSCPEGQKARSEVWSDGFATNLAVAVLPFVVIGAVAAGADGIGRRSKGARQ